MFEKEKLTPAQTVVRMVCKIKKNERVLIISNPSMGAIAQNLYTAILEEGALPVLMYQPVKTLLDAATSEVLAAIKTEPDVIFSISEQKLGKDPDRKSVV